MKIRKADKNDLTGILRLYSQMHNIEVPEISDEIKKVWKRILDYRDQHVIVGIKDGTVIATCVIIIVPNLTHELRPYALIENVVTDENHRNKGFASQILDYAKEIAVRENCYKIMLLTSSKEDSVLRFYEKAGYNRNDKTAFIQWLK
jgi:GNAT superfamily N-acetyltransferase